MWKFAFATAGVPILIANVAGLVVEHAANHVAADIHPEGFPRVLLRDR
jgi:hypothetical protein